MGSEPIGLNPTFLEKEIVVEGEIRKDTNNGRLVELVKFLYEETKDGRRFICWRVRDVLNESLYRVREGALSCKAYTEMEVLAWAAK